MVVFSSVENVQWQDRCLNFSAQLPLDGLFRRVDHFLLRVVMAPNGGHVLRTSNSTTRIMALPEEINDVGKGYLSRIEVDFHRFRVVSEIVVRGELFPASCVADARAVHTFDNPKLGFRSPESAKSECRCLQVFGHGAVDFRNGFAW